MTQKPRHQLTLFCEDDLSGPLAAGSVGLRALVYERYALAMTSGLITEVYDTLVGATELQEAGYVDLNSDGDAWIPSGRLTYEETAFFQPTCDTIIGGSR